MAGKVDIQRGDIWTYEFRHPDKRRPVLIVSRPEAIAVLHTVLVAPITSTIRGLPSEVVVGIQEGLKNDSAANLDHIQTVERARLAARGRSPIFTKRTESVRSGDLGPQIVSDRVLGSE